MNTHKNLLKLQHVIQHRNWPEALVIIQKLIDNQPTNTPLAPEERAADLLERSVNAIIFGQQSRIAELQKENETLTLELDAQYKTVESSYSKNAGLQSQLEAKDKELAKLTKLIQEAEQYFGQTFR